MSPKKTAKDREYIKQRHDNYLVSRSEAEKIAVEMSGRHEKQQTLLTGGALALSLTYIEKLAPAPIQCTKGVVIIAWAALIYSMWQSMKAMEASKNAHQKKIENLDLEYQQLIDPDNKDYKGQSTKDNPFDAKVKKANKKAQQAAIIGISSLIVFVALNFILVNNHEKQEPNKPEASFGKSSATELICANEKPRGFYSTKASGENEIQTREINMQSKQPNQPKHSTTPTPVRPPEPGQPLIETYVPASNPVVLPPPPKTTKDGK